MRLIVADTSPIFYLLSIGHIDLLPQLFGNVFVPEAVHKELGHPAAPKLVREWVAVLPAWMEVTPVNAIDCRLPTAGRRGTSGDHARTVPARRSDFDRRA
jgi:predicted nucleic acid-binding protein